jgi:hypothetical protein
VLVKGSTAFLLELAGSKACWRCLLASSVEVQMSLNFLDNLNDTVSERRITLAHLSATALLEIYAK